MLGSLLVKQVILLRKMCLKNGSKKVPRQSQTAPYSNPGGSRRSSLACALFKQETVVRATVEALFELLAEKSELDSKSVQKTDWIAELLQKTLNGLLKIVDC